VILPCPPLPSPACAHRFPSSTLTANLPPASFSSPAYFSHTVATPLLISQPESLNLTRNPGHDKISEFVCTEAIAFFLPAVMALEPSFTIEEVPPRSESAATLGHEKERRRKGGSLCSSKKKAWG